MKPDQHAQTKGTRRLAWTSALMFAVALGLAGSTFYAQKRTADARLANPAPRRAPDLTPAQKQQSIARAKYLRDKWRPWASKNRAILSRMLQAKPDDRAALATVWAALPSGSPNEKEGIPLDELQPPGTMPPSPTGFAWIPTEKVMQQALAKSQSSQESQANIRRFLSTLPHDRQVQFEKFRDAVVATSLTGRTQVHLWASGRITTWSKLTPKERPKIVGRSRLNSDLYSPHHEVEPPFDFLESST